MREYVCFNHKIARVSEAFLPAVSPAAFYGRGIFTTVAVFYAKPFQWEKHWRRLNDDASRINLDLMNFKEEEVKISLAEVAAKNKLVNGRARLTFFDESSGGVWQFQAGRKTGFLIVVADARPVAPNLRLTISPYTINSQSPLAGVKSCNYLENLLALERAQRAGFDEAIRPNEKGAVTAACQANVFWVKNREIFTPRLETGALAGTTRAFVLENFSVTETEANPDELSTAEEVFLTSAGVGLARVGSFEKTKYKKTTDFNRVKKAFLNAFEA